MKKLLFLFSYLLFISITIISSSVFDLANACTVWGAFTPSELFIAKNRDFYPGNQKFITVQHPNKYKFFGLYADKDNNGEYTIRMGINEKGLVVFMTFASTVPAELHTGKVAYFELIEKILDNYDSVNNIQADAGKLFDGSEPVNYVFADKNKVMLCEVGLENAYHCEEYTRNKKDPVTTFAQTNHYIFSDLRQYNKIAEIDEQTSYKRLEKINQLMQGAVSQKSTLDDFIAMSFNTDASNDIAGGKFDIQNSYQDNSIFRTFNSHPDRRNPDHADSDRSVSAMIVKLPEDSSHVIELYLRIINSIEDKNDEKHTQIIKYTEARTTLAQAMMNSDKIQYEIKSCKRDKASTACE